MELSIKEFVIVVIIGTAVLAVSSAWNDSIIVDEVPHIGAGYSYLTQGDMRLNPEHPPLAKDIAAFPLLFIHLNQSAFKSHFWTTDVNGQWEFGRLLIFNSGNNADLIRHLVKLPMILFFLSAAWLIFVWGRELYGDRGGLLAVILFCFSPTVLAHSRFVTTDVPALWGILFASYFYIKYLNKPTQKHFIWAALFFGLALLAKFSTFLLVPYLGLLSLCWGLIHGKNTKDGLKSAVMWGFRSVAVFAVGFVFIVWPVYYLHTMNYPPVRQHRDTEQILATYGNRTFADPIVWMSDKPVLRAAGQYGLGLLMVTQRAVGGNTTYFLGEVSKDGWRSYFPIVYFLKEPLAWWLLVMIAILALPLQLRSRPKWAKIDKWLKEHFAQFSMLVWLAVYWGLSVHSTLNIGVRHILPTYPFAMLLVVGQVGFVIDHVYWLGKKEFRQMGWLIALILGWYVFESVHVYPYYLTYFNQVAGGPSGGYEYVVDSNLDWGQDLIRFSDWVKENKISKIEFDYFGWADASYYLKDRYIWLNSTKYLNGKDFINRNESNGWLAVSATFLEGSVGTPDQPQTVNYLWLKSYKPVTVIGNSIFVYHITK